MHITGMYNIRTYMYIFTLECASLVRMSDCMVSSVCTISHTSFSQSHNYIVGRQREEEEYNISLYDD